MDGRHTMNADAPAIGRPTRGSYCFILPCEYIDEYKQDETCARAWCMLRCVKERHGWRENRPLDVVLYNIITGWWEPISYIEHAGAEFSELSHAMHDDWAQPCLFLGGREYYDVVTRRAIIYSISIWVMWKKMSKHGNPWYHRTSLYTLSCCCCLKCYLYRVQRGRGLWTIMRSHSIILPDSCSSSW